VRNEIHNQDQRQQLSLWNVLAIIVITLAIGVGLFILLEDQPEQLISLQKPQRPTPQPSTGISEQRQKPGNAARALIAQIKASKTSPQLDDIFAKAQEFNSTGQLEDAYLLLFYAARLGHIPSAGVLGGIYDPNHFNESKSIIDEPDLTQAYKWYKIAADSGDDIAANRLAQLKIAVEKAADKGSEEAKALLLKWN
jgi:hypothetical protein